MASKSTIKKADLDKLNAKVKARGHVDREHLMEFLQIIPTSDALVIIQEVRQWLTDLRNDPNYEKVVFPQNDIDAIIGDLDSYGRVQPETILQFKQDSARNVNPT